jgi:hypothetical protein
VTRADPAILDMKVIERRFSSVASSVSELFGPLQLGSSPKLLDSQISG